MRFALPFFLLPLATTAILSPSIPLTKIKTLTLRADKLTSARRLSAIPQLKCIGGNAKGLYEVDAMRCTNVGSDYDGADVQWTCTAILPSDFKLGSTEVLCEGYDSPEDPRVLKGSCGVEYRLMLTPKGEEKYASHSTGGIAGQIVFWLSALFIATVVLCILAALASALRDCFTNRSRPPGGRGWGGWGGGGGGDDGNDPPPPYSSFPPKSGSSNQQYRPGFWTGAAAGAAGAYVAAIMARSNNQPNQGRSGWGGGRGSSSSSASSGSSNSSTTYQSTGFGGTTRR